MPPATLTTTEAVNNNNNHHHHPSILVIGNYCHDLLNTTNPTTTLGGAASFISNVFDSLSPSSDLRFVSKVGSDFAFSLPHPPIVSPASPTTLFQFLPSTCGAAAAGDRVLKRVNSCDPILPSDVPSVRFRFGLAVAVGGEILPETLARLVEICDLVFVDIQGLIRSFDPADGTVGLVELKSTPFFDLLPRIGFLKASAEEAAFIDVEEVRKVCCVIVTEGKDGCRICWKDGEVKVKPFAAEQVDPTGAGDSFLGGFVAGLCWGMSVPDAALLGNFFGSLTVGQIGIPKFDQRMAQHVKEELGRRIPRCIRPSGEGILLDFQKSDSHEALQEFLNESEKLATAGSDI